MEVAFSTISVSTVSGAPLRPARTYSRSDARNPNGVAALDNPSKFAVTLALTASIACLSCDALPNKGRRTGAIRRDSRSASPEACSNSITPLQKHISPVILIASVIASAAPVGTAAVTSASLPVTAPHSSAIQRNTVQITDSISCSPFPSNIPSEWDLVIHFL